MCGWADVPIGQHTTEHAQVRAAGVEMTMVRKKVPDARHRGFSNRFKVGWFGMDGCCGTGRCFFWCGAGSGTHAL